MNVRVKWLLLVLLPLATSSVLAEGDFIQGAKVWAEVCGGKPKISGPLKLLGFSVVD